LEFKIKDAYHVEGEVYAELEKDGVRNIPTILAEGEVDSDAKAYHFCGTFPPGWNAPLGIRKHIHYRIVFGVVGRPLVAFRSTHELSYAILGAVEGQSGFRWRVYYLGHVVADLFSAHRDASAAGIQHRDISPSNIIIVEDPDTRERTGNLIDWEFARFDSDNEARAYDRTVYVFFSFNFCILNTRCRVLGNLSLRAYPVRNLRRIQKVMTWNHFTLYSFGSQHAMRLMGCHRMLENGFFSPLTVLGGKG